MASDRSQLERFNHEADLFRQLDHPNIVRVYEAGVLQVVHYIAMELGCDLGHLLRQLRQRGLELPIDFAVYLVKVLLDALAYAHGARSPDGELLAIVHGDVSPANLFVSRSGEIKLGDFGIAKTAMGASRSCRASRITSLPRSWPAARSQNRRTCGQPRSPCTSC